MDVHNWTYFRREKLHPAEMNQNRVEEISIEMCELLNEQTERLKGRTGSLSHMSGEEVVGYNQRNNRLRQLGEELSEIEK
jgi:hypothetical protein